jgi:hypothetical protein
MVSILENLLNFYFAKVYFNTFLIHINVKMLKIENEINIFMSWSSLVGQVELIIKFPFEIRWPTRPLY